MTNRKTGDSGKNKVIKMKVKKTSYRELEIWSKFEKEMLKIMPQNFMEEARTASEQEGMLPLVSARKGDVPDDTIAVDSL